MRPLLLAGVWLVYLLCPPSLSYDSYWTVATALSLVHHATTRVDAYVATAPEAANYGLECAKDGHCYNLYPEGTAVLAAPLVASLEIAVAIVRPIVPRTGPLFSRPEVLAFFSGDLLFGRALTELGCASLIGVLAVWVQFRIARCYLPPRQATLLALLFAFGTSAWSVGSRSLLPHGLTLLLLSGALYFLIDAQHTPVRLWIAGLLLALSFTVRPSNAISCIVLGLYVAVHLRPYLLRFLAGALPVTIAFFTYEVVVRHTWIPQYVRIAINRMPYGEGILMHLFSPSRGLLIFTPIVFISLAGLVLAWRARWCWPLLPWLTAIPLLHFALVAGAWPGHGFGARFFADLTHLWILWLIPAILWWHKTQRATRRVSAGAFLLLAAWGVFVHARGAASIAVNQWSSLPVNVDQARARVWDWRDPQFLRGLK
jgi:hypothetical protein